VVAESVKTTEQPAERPEMPHQALISEDAERKISSPGLLQDL
jgi:hypothetical protein